MTGSPKPKHWGRLLALLTFETALMLGLFDVARRLPPPVVRAGYPVCKTAITAEESWKGLRDEAPPPVDLPNGCVRAPAELPILLSGKGYPHGPQGWSSSAREVRVRMPDGSSGYIWTVVHAFLPRYWL
jgi:hypothetical protein